MEFRNRLDAGRRLARMLASYRGTTPLVLAIPRGGVPVGRMLADALDGELDVVLVHKLVAPISPEYAVGSISEDGRVEIGPDARDLFQTPADLESGIREQARLMKERRERYTPVKAPADPRGRVVIVVDDGLATGFTMLAALRSVRQRSPLRLVAAVPVSPPETLQRVKSVADETVCVCVPDFFGAVGRFYADFDPVSDEEVIEHLREARTAPKSASSRNGIS